MYAKFLMVMSMSGGKKKRTKVRMFTEVELKRRLRQGIDDAVKRIMLLCIVAARDKFKLDAEDTVDFMETMARYIKWEKEGLVDLNVASESLKKNTGIDLKLSRW